jgi:hypothetical protein
MNNRPSTKVVGSHSANLATRRANRKIPGRRRGKLAYVLTAGVLLTALGGAIWLATGAKLPTLSLSNGPGQTTTSPPVTEPRTANIVFEPTANRCRQIVFDNDTGRRFETVRPCEKNTILDSKGVPVPLGTVRRLDAISKSFSKQ